MCSVRSAPLLVPCLPHTIEVSQYVKSMLLLIVLLLTMPLPPTITMCFCRSPSAAPSGSKWLFKQEDPTLWSLQPSPSPHGTTSDSSGGALALRTDAMPGIESAFPANMLLQRPTAAYYRIETKLVWPLAVGNQPPNNNREQEDEEEEGAAGGGGGTRCGNPGAAAGLIARCGTHFRFPRLPFNFSRSLPRACLGKRSVSRAD